MAGFAVARTRPIYYNVMAYGAKGDGSTDDYAAFARAIDDANDVGGVVYVPASTSTYKLSATLTLGGASIMGASAVKSILVWTDATSCPGIITASGVWVAYLTLRGASGRDSTFLDLGGNTGTYDSGSSGLLLGSQDHVTVEDCVVESFGDCGIQCGGDSSFHKILRVISRYNANEGIFLAAATDCIVDGCEVYGNAYNGIDSNGSRHTISKCTVYNNGIDAVTDKGTAQNAGTDATHIQLRSAASFADNALAGFWVVITGGSTGVGQARAITSNVGATDTCLVPAWTTTPSGTITYIIFPATLADRFGIYIGGLDGYTLEDTKIVDCHVYANKSHGIYVQAVNGGVAGTVRRHRVMDCSSHTAYVGAGIVFDASSGGAGVMEYCKAIGCDAHLNSLGGYISQGADYNILEACVADLNWGDAGFAIVDDYTQVLNCDAKANTGIGFWIASAAATKCAVKNCVHVGNGTNLTDAGTTTQLSGNYA